MEVLERLISCYDTDNIDDYVSQYCGRTSLVLEKKDIDIGLIKNGWFFKLFASALLLSSSCNIDFIKETISSDKVKGKIYFPFWTFW